MQKHYTNEVRELHHQLLKWGADPLEICEMIKDDKEVPEARRKIYNQLYLYLWNKKNKNTSA